MYTCSRCPTRYIRRWTRQSSPKPCNIIHYINKKSVSSENNYLVSHAYLHVARHAVCVVVVCYAYRVIYIATCT